MQLHELNDETLAYLMHRWAELALASTPWTLNGAIEAVSKVTDVPVHSIRWHLSETYRTVGERPSPRTNYYIVWERDAVQALRKRLSENEEVRDA